MEQELSPQKKGKSPTAKRNEPDKSGQPSKTNSGSVEVKARPEEEQGAGESTAGEVQHDAQLGAATVESLEDREDFKRHLEAIMDATKVPSLIILVVMVTFITIVVQ